MWERKAYFINTATQPKAKERKGFGREVPETHRNALEGDSSLRGRGPGGRGGGDWAALLKKLPFQRGSGLYPDRPKGKEKMD